MSYDTRERISPNRVIVNEAVVPRPHRDSLDATTALGLYMSWQTSRRRAMLLWFAAGTVLPMLMMLAV